MDLPAQPRAVPIVPFGLPAAVPARPMAPPPKTRPPIVRSWPAAFRTCKQPAQHEETIQVVHEETQDEPLALPAPSADDAAAIADIRQRVHALYGGMSATVTLEPQPDGSMLVHVRLRAAAEPSPAAPDVRVLVEMEK